MSARYVRGGCGTSMYHVLPPPCTMMSRTGVSDVLVVSRLVTSNSRMMSRAPCQSCLSAASARWIECGDSSQYACSQYGFDTASRIRSFVIGADDRAGASFAGAGADFGTSGLVTDGLTGAAAGFTRGFVAAAAAGL